MRKLVMRKKIFRLAEITLIKITECPSYLPSDAGKEFLVKRTDGPRGCADADGGSIFLSILKLFPLNCFFYPILP